MIEFNDGMICFSGGNTWIQKCIKFFTRSNFSHSFVVIKIDGYLKALETTSTVVVCNNVCDKYFEENYIECWEITNKCMSAQMAMLSIKAKYCYEGCWYGYMSYIWFMYRWLMRLFGIEKKTMWPWCIQGITCTELTCKSLPATCKPSQDDNAISPEELRNYFISMPHLFKCIGNIEIKRKR